MHDDDDSGRDPLLDDFDDMPATISQLTSTTTNGDNVNWRLPRSYAEAMRTQDSVLWSAAVLSEVQSLVDNNTFELVPISSLPSGCSSIKSAPGSIVTGCEKSVKNRL